MTDEAKDQAGREEGAKAQGVQEILCQESGEVEHREKVSRKTAKK